MEEVSLVIGSEISRQAADYEDRVTGVQGKEWEPGGHKFAKRKARQINGLLVAGSLEPENSQ